MCECVGAKEPAVTERGDGAASKDRDGGGEACCLIFP